MKCINLSPAALLLLLNCCVVNAQEYHNAGENIERRGAEDAKDTMPDIMKIVVGCFVGAFILMVAFFCVKIYADFKERNRPIEDRGPFGTMREVNVSLLTPCQRRAVLEVLFSNDKCMVYHDETKEAVTDIHNEDQMSLNVDTQESETQERGDEENPVVRQNTTCNNTTDEMMMPSFPVLSTPERPHKKSKANVFAILPHLPKRPLFTLIPPYDCEDEGRHNSNIDCITNNQVEDDEENQQTKLEECPHTPRAAVHVHASQLEDLEDDIQSDSCPICLDMYDEGDFVVQSEHCSHMFHRECIMEWLQQKSECPCCRSEMVSPDDLANAVSTVINKYGVKREILIRNNSMDLTPPSSPMSNNTVISTTPQLL